MSACEPLTPDVLAAIDPGVRDLVVQLRAAGFQTTDSGDGVSKPKDWYESGCAMPFPHVAAVVDAGPHDTLLMMSCMASAMASICGQGWTTEATYSTRDGRWTLLATKVATCPK